MLYVQNDLTLRLVDFPEVSLTINGHEGYITIIKYESCIDPEKLTRVTIESLKDDRVQGTLYLNKTEVIGLASCGSERTDPHFESVLNLPARCSKFSYATMLRAYSATDISCLL